MDGGGADSAGIRRSREASTAMRSSSKKVGRFIVEGIACGEGESGRTLIGRLAFPADAATSRFALAFGVERLGGASAAGFFHPDFDPAFSLFSVFLAVAGA